MIWRWIVGTVLVVVAVVYAIDPGLFGADERPADLYEAIERRVKLGGVVALGFFVVHGGWRAPWHRIAAAVVGWFAAGYLLVRVIGIGLEGHEQGQWIFVAIEVAMMVACAWWVRRVDAGMAEGIDTPAAPPSPDR